MKHSGVQLGVWWGKKGADHVKGVTISEKIYHKYEDFTHKDLQTYKLQNTFTKFVMYLFSVNTFIK